MAEKLHSHYKKASNLIFVLLFIELLEFGYSNYVEVKSDFGFTLTALVFIAFTGYVTRSGVNWVKYILLVLSLLIVAGIALSFSNSTATPANLLIASVQAMLLITATVWLFKIPTSTPQDPLDSDI